MRCVAYIRVSTKEQDEQVQRKAMEEFSRNRNIEIVKWCIDKGESGGKMFRNRSAAQLMLRDLDNMKLDCILSWALDRIGRNMLDTVNTILEFQNRGVKVLTVKEEWLQTLDDNVRKLILSILSWVAEYERKRIRERQEAAWASGKQKGRPEKISKEEVEYYLKKYPDLSLKDILRIINAERKEKRKPEISYWTLYKKVRELGYRKEFAR